MKCADPGSVGRAGSRAPKVTPAAPACESTSVDPLYAADGARSPVPGPAQFRQQLLYPSAGAEPATACQCSKRALTDSPLWIRRMASAKAGATDSTLSLSVSMSFDTGTVLVHTISRTSS
jgi:hypothetical protein